MIPLGGDRIRVLMISPQFRPLVGGYERAAERLSAAMAQRGLRVFVITERRDRRWPAFESSDGYEVRRLPCLYRRYFHGITSLLASTGYLLVYGRNFDIWHVHQYGLYAALAVMLGKLLGRPVVLKLTSSNAMGIEQAMRHGSIGRLLAALHRRVDACLAVSEETREEAIRFGIPAQRVYLLPNGVDGSHFHPVTTEERIAARRTLGLDCQRLVLYVGRLSPEKNPLGLLDAWAAVDSRTREGALLALVGNGPEWDKVNAKIQNLNLEDSVYLAGRRSDVATWYRAADIYVMASHYEGLSNTMIEALASGLPIVATRVSGAVEHLFETGAGIIVPIGDMMNLASAIQMLLDKSDRRAKMGGCGRAVFEQRFSIDAVSARVCHLYESLLLRKLDI